MVKNFTFKEMIATSTGLANYPETWEQLDNIILTTTRLQIIREAFGAPIRVNCCFRSPQVNAKVGGSATSAHLKGLAADITAGNEAGNRKLYQVCLDCLGDLGFDQLILYSEKPGDRSSRIRFIHVGFATDRIPRKQLLFK